MAATEGAPADRPVVSVVIPSVSGLPALRRCLDALARQDSAVVSEIVVVDRCGDGTRDAIRRQFPGVHVLAAGPRTSIPALRVQGIAAARGKVIAILEDHCNVAPGWMDTAARAHAAGHRVVGGAVENGSVRRLVDWAAFFCEYAPFMPPLLRGEAAAITGNNSLYDRALLEELGPELRDELWEWFLHRRLAARGARFHCEPALVVVHEKEFSIGYFLAQRYHYSRSFTAMRLAGAPRWRRLAFAAATPLLPAVVLGRITATVARKGRHRGRFVQAFPLLVLFVLGWAWGDAAGALLGAGHSLEKVE